MMRFKSLGSGSSGNATLIESSHNGCTTRVLVDCGFGLRQLEQRLVLAGVASDQIDAIFITHEHADHTGCVRQLVMRHGLPVWMSQGTHAGLQHADFADWLRIARDDQPFEIGSLQIRPFTVPHDAREPLQLTCTDGASTLGILTDLGHVTSHVNQRLQACTALLLECNHDPDLMAQSAYPAFLKQRIGGRLGHLANAAAAALLSAVQHPGLRHVVAAHLSEQNNRPELAQRALANALGALPTEIIVAGAQDGTGWLQI